MLFRSPARRARRLHAEHRRPLQLLQHGMQRLGFATDGCWAEPEPYASTDAGGKRRDGMHWGGGSSRGGRGGEVVGARVGGGCATDGGEVWGRRRVVIGDRARRVGAGVGAGAEGRWGPLREARIRLVTRARAGVGLRRRWGRLCRRRTGGPVHLSSSGEKASQAGAGAARGGEGAHELRIVCGGARLGGGSVQSEHRGEHGGETGAGA